MRTKLTLIMSAVLLGACVPSAQALSQWARKFGMSCNTCHTSFPRLTYFGEKFMRNGYQMPGTMDGSTMKKIPIAEDLKSSQLGDVLGVRINIEPVKIEENALTINGQKRDRTSYGKSNWVQFFAAGAVRKNISLFSEIQLDTDGGNHQSWFRAGWHNIGGDSAFNIRTGQLSKMDWAAFSGRLRLGFIKPLLRNVKTSSRGDPIEANTISSNSPGIELYGYTDSGFLYSLGVSNGGGKIKDSDDEHTTFGTIGYEITDGEFAGSKLTYWLEDGTDLSKGNNLVTNDYDRSVISLALRWDEGRNDVVFAWLDAEESNIGLAVGVPGLPGLPAKYDGYTLQYGRVIDNKWYAAVEYDEIDFDTPAEAAGAKDDKRLTLQVWHFFHQNLKMGLLVEVDKEDNGVPNSTNDAITLAIRGMF